LHRNVRAAAESPAAGEWHVRYMSGSANEEVVKRHHDAQFSGFLVGQSDIKLPEGFK